MNNVPGFSEKVVSQRKTLETEIEFLIEQGSEIWQSTAERLDKIRDNGSWIMEAKSFRAYIETRFNKTSNWAYNLMRARATMKQLTEGKSPKEVTAVTKLVDTESAARNLSAVPQELRGAVVDHISSAHKTATPEAIAQAVEAVKPMKKAKVVLKDDTGFPIPESLHATWNRRDELVRLATQISELKCEIEKARKREDPIFMKLHASVIDDLKAAYHCAHQAKLYCVCGDCQGRFETVKKGVCACCNSTGFMTKQQYDRLLPEQIKAIRERAVKAQKD